MKTTIVIRGNITRENGKIQAQLHNIGSDCKIRILSVTLIPIDPAMGQAIDDRLFQISTDLITRPSFAEMGVLQTGETPLFLFLHAVQKKKLGIHDNYHSDWFDINNPCTYCHFQMTELAPRLKGSENNLDYKYDLTIRVGLEMPDKK